MADDSRSLRRPFGALAPLVALLAACSSATLEKAPGADVDAASDLPPSADAGTPSDDDASAPRDAAPAQVDGGDAGGDAGASDDGTPTRRACTSTFGTGLSTKHGRLDGTLVAVIPPGQGKQCNGDGSHVHLQVLAGGAVYDVAANVDGIEAEIDAPLRDGAWGEGWHPNLALDYPRDLGAHVAAFTLTGTSAVAAKVEAALAQANHVSIFCTGYGPDGCHLVHRKGTGIDGAIVIDPLAPTSHWLLFAFTGDTF